MTSSEYIRLVAHGGQFIVPRGGTVHEAGDRLLVVADRRARAEVREIVGSFHQTVGSGAAPVLLPRPEATNGGDSGAALRE